MCNHGWATGVSRGPVSAVVQGKHQAMGLQIVLYTTSNTVVNDVVQENEELFIAVYKHTTSRTRFILCDVKRYRSVRLAKMYIPW